jgi:hypothetical protein
MRENRLRNRIPLLEAQRDHSQQRADRLWVRHRQVVALRAQGILNHPEQLLVGIFAKAAGIAATITSRYTPLQEEIAIGQQGKTCNWQGCLCVQDNHRSD